MKRDAINLDADSVTRFQTNELLTNLTAWVEAMQGRGSVECALEGLAKIAGADSVALVENSQETKETRNIAIFDKSAGKLFSNRRWKAFGPDIIGSAHAAAAVGSVWTKADRVDQELIEARFARSPEVEPKEIIAIVLESTPTELTLIEFHYAVYPRPSGINAVNIIATHIATAWINRIPGISYVPAIRLIVSDVETDETRIVSERILTHENPFSLSRTEFRVCMLLRSGASTKAIARLMGSREKTVRSHLSSIYSKIGVAGQIELLHRLIGSNSNGDEQRAANAN